MVAITSSLQFGVKLGQYRVLQRRFGNNLHGSVCCGQAGVPRPVNPAHRPPSTVETAAPALGPGGEPLDGTGVYLPSKNPQGVVNVPGP